MERSVVREISRELDREFAKGTLVEHCGARAEEDPRGGGEEPPPPGLYSAIIGQRSSPSARLHYDGYT